MAAAREEESPGGPESSFSPHRHATRPPHSPTLPWDRFSNWLHCICVVTFDLELGQAMELVYPGHIKLSEKEAVWETHSSVSGYVRVLVGRHRHTQTHTGRGKHQSTYIGTTHITMSLVLITRLPFNNLFNFLAEVVAPEYFDNGEPCLEAACHDIDQWPSPQPGETLSLPMMGMVIQVRIPSKQDKLATTPVQVIHQQSTVFRPV
ncbi:Protein dennd6a [Branchiostoma belcheri]|nr:Protein dennd6a [Branchiostoma belcheri]